MHTHYEILQLVMLLWTWPITPSLFFFNYANPHHLPLSHQMRDMELSRHYGDELEDMHPHSRCNEPPDMPMPTCFRSRSHSYLRAIQAGCSQDDDDTASMDSDSPPPTTTTTVRTYSNSTGEYHTHQMSISYRLTTEMNNKAPLDYFHYKKKRTFKKRTEFQEFMPLLILSMQRYI